MTKIDWPEQFPNSSTPRFHGIHDKRNVYALNEQTGEILLQYDFRRPIVIKVDYKIPKHLDRCHCLQIKEESFLLLEEGKGERSDGFVRVGCAPQHDETDYFKHAKSQVVTLY
jgi:hypothetical protein